MRVFVTGASGHIASAVIAELIGAGHTVLGLARSDQAAELVRERGAEVLLGDLSDMDAITHGARKSDGVIHLAFDHAAQGAGDLAGAVATDLAAVQGIGTALAGSGKPFVGTNATGGLALAGLTGRVLTEADTLPGGPRIDTENAVSALEQQSVRSSVVRLPPAVYADGQYGFVSGLIDIARTTGIVGYLGNGDNRWGATHTAEVAVLYRLALETAPAGSRLHAVAEEGIPMHQIADTISARLGIPVQQIADDRAGEHFGFLAPFAAMDNPASSYSTRRALGWTPTQPGLLAALEEDGALIPITA